MEELIAIAGQAGFEMDVVRTSDTSSINSAAEDSASHPYSVCVAALPYEAADRYRPFNFNKDPQRDLIERNATLLKAAARALSSDGLLFVYGLPAHLARYATNLNEASSFRYWIAVRAMTAPGPDGLRPEHTGLLIFSGPDATLSRVRVPHPRCRSCGETLKDWGGKSHLMRSDGVALSDVWMDLVVDPQDRMPPEIFERIIQLAGSLSRRRMLLLVPELFRQSVMPFVRPPAVSSFNPLERRPGDCRETLSRTVPEDLIDRLHNRSCLEVLKKIPSETVDLAFADPPFNLTKGYNGYSDDLRESDYVGWCKRWLAEYRRVVKPGGAIVVLNLPKWSFRLADFLCRMRGLYLQNWIVWNSLPEPKGVLMPAHYSLLYLTKGERAARFNYCTMEKGWEPFDEAVFPPDRPDLCNRRTCIRRRRSSPDLWRGELTDVWYDIYRVRRAKRGAPDHLSHPCRTPEMLVDRVIRLTTNPGDIVLDAFAGTGTTALIARRLGRRFIAIEQAREYLQMAEARMDLQRGYVRRERASSNRTGISRRRLQIELQRLAVELGRAPTKHDVERLSIYGLEAYEQAFRSWSVALKAVRAVACDNSYYGYISQERSQSELFAEATNNDRGETEDRLC